MRALVLFIFFHGFALVILTFLQLCAAIGIVLLGLVQCCLSGEVDSLSRSSNRVCLFINSGHCGRLLGRLHDGRYEYVRHGWVLFFFFLL